MIQNPFFPEIHGNFGFGCMRLPMKDGHVDYDEFCRMADAFIASGLNYFDTAHGYCDGSPCRHRNDRSVRGSPGSDRQADHTGPRRTDRCR